MTVISGLDIGEDDIYIVRNFLNDAKPISHVRLPLCTSFEQAISLFSGKLFPKSYTYYMLAVHQLGITPDNDTWDNLIFIGDYRGKYNYEERVFEHAQSLGIGAGSPVEIAYRDALASTYKSIQHAIKSR